MHKKDKANKKDKHCKKSKIGKKNMSERKDKSGKKIKSSKKLHKKMHCRKKNKHDRTSGFSESKVQKSEDVFANVDEVRSDVKTKHAIDGTIKGSRVKDGFELTKSSGSSITPSLRDITVGSLERILLKQFPKEDAESWDVMGLTVGDRSQGVDNIAIALDPTVMAIDRAASLGCNVLVTHHPPYLEAPNQFSPAASVAVSPGAGVWAAIENNVALMNFHTALDVSKRAQGALPELLGFLYTGALLCSIPTSPNKGYGQICKVPPVDGAPESLGNIAAKCTSVFGKAPRVWGDFNWEIRTCATVLGSSGNVAEAALNSGVDCIICGEIGYHRALELSQAGLGIIEIGHDLSEIPLVAVLARTLADSGIPTEKIIMIDQPDNWVYPDAVRL